MNGDDIYNEYHGAFLARSWMDRFRRSLGIGIEHEFGFEFEPCAVAIIARWFSVA